MLEVICAGAFAKSTIDWGEAWNNSPEREANLAEINRIHEGGRSRPLVEAALPTEFATPWMYQMKTLLVRNFRIYWRDPTYIMSKLALSTAAGLFIGFSYWRAKDTIQGAQTKLFTVFISLMICVPVANQLQVPFIDMRTIYDIRERPSKMYKRTALLTSQILIELPFNILGCSLYFVCWYFPIGFETSRAGYTYLMIGIVQPLYFTTLAQAVAAISPDATIAALLFSALFCFVLTL